MDGIANAHALLSAPWRWLPDIRDWGSTPDERRLAFPCDHYLPEADDVLYRALTVDAPAPIVFRWLCQLRVAPYSYDWIDNAGRRSPRQLVPGLERLERGQRVMGLFELVDFETDRQVTALSAPSRFGRFAATYRVVPVGAEQSRLVVKLRATYGTVLRPLLASLLPAGDWVMMRKQLLTLKELAEASHRLRCASLPAAGRSSPTSPV